MRLKDFVKERYVYLTYSIGNDERERTRELLREYRKLLSLAMEYLWNGIKVERKVTDRRRYGVKIQLPKKKEVYNLREELEKVNALASHYADRAINDAFS